MSLVTIGVIVLAALGIAWFGWAIVAGGSLRQVEESTPLPMPRRKRGPLNEAVCPVCGQAGVYLTKAGQANRRYHRCPVPNFIMPVSGPVVTPYISPTSGSGSTGTWPPEVAS